MSRYHDLAANAKRRPVDQAEANVYPGARASRSQLVPHRFGQMDLFELDDLVLGGRIAGRKGVQSVSQQACLPVAEHGSRQTQEVEPAAIAAHHAHEVHKSGAG